jgi:hypothetical protein
MSFKNNYLVRKRESESMATLADLWRRVICSKITTESPIYRCLGSKIECVKLYRTRLKIISFISREKKLSI